jgi:hypothetical protein
MEPVVREVRESRYAPCPPEEFVGRTDERQRIRDLLSRSPDAGRALAIVGATGLGKSSLLRRIAHETGARPGGGADTAVIGRFSATEGQIFSTYRDVLAVLKRNGLWTGESESSLKNLADLFDRYTAPVHPVGMLARVGEEVIGVFADVGGAEFDEVRSAFLASLRSVGNAARRRGGSVVLILDDLKWASEPDFLLTLELVRHPPPGIFVAVAWDEGAADDGRYHALRESLTSSGGSEMVLSPLSGPEVREVALRRFGIAITDETADMLARDLGTPFALTVCFSLLRIRARQQDRESFAALLPELENPAARVYIEAEPFWQERARTLSVLNPPFPGAVVACMLESERLSLRKIQTDLEQSTLFWRVGPNTYDFAHPLLRDYCREMASESEQTALHADAVRCFERFADRLSDKQHALVSLADHLFGAGEYTKALPLCLELGRRYRDLGAYGAARTLTGQAIGAAETGGDTGSLAAAREQQESIRRAREEAEGMR